MQQCKNVIQVINIWVFFFFFKPFSLEIVLTETFFDTKTEHMGNLCLSERIHLQPSLSSSLFCPNPRNSGKSVSSSDSDGRVSLSSPLPPSFSHLIFFFSPATQIGFCSVRPRVTDDAWRCLKDRGSGGGKGGRVTLFEQWKYQWNQSEFFCMLFWL